jgi:hypothetical protein
MAGISETRGLVRPATRTGLRTSDRGYQAFKILHVGYIIAPTVAGLDKVFHLVANWEQYLAPRLAQLSPVSPRTLMVAVGVIEIAAGLLVAVKPRVGAYVVAAWLAGIIVNLLLLGTFLDVALRDLGLLLGALALGRLSEVYGRGQPPSTATSR